MAITSGYFNSLNGDRKYNAETMSKYYSGIISRGVLQNWLNSFSVVATSGMTVNVNTGRAYFSDGRWVENSAAYPLTIGASSVSLNRIDRIVLRKDSSSNSRTCTLYVKAGSPATEPTAPTLESSETVEEISLAQIYVAALSESVTQANITDERGLDVCGFVHGLINQISTNQLFLQYDAAFNEWFSTVKETLSTSTLIRSYESHYTTTADNQTEIPIGISQYNSALDILNVFINGMKLIRGVDFAQAENDNEKITLALGLATGQQVNFEVFKSVDGSAAETVVQQVYELQQSVNKIDEYIYYTTGENDNTKLSAICQEYFADATAPERMTISVVGNNFAMSTAPISGDGTASSRYKWFNFGYAGTTTKKLTLDFGKCSGITLADAKTNTLIMQGKNVVVRNMKMTITTGGAVTFTESQQSEYYNCDISMTGSGVMCFARCCGIFENNKIRVESTNDNAFCFEGTGTNFQRVTGGTYYAYTGAQAKVAAAFYAPTGTASNILLMTNCNCPISAVTGRFQSECVKINSGNYALFGNILGKAASIASGATGAQQGTIIASVVV